MPGCFCPNPRGCGLFEIFPRCSSVAARRGDAPSSRLEKSQKYSQQMRRFLCYRLLECETQTAAQVSHISGATVKVAPVHKQADVLLPPILRQYLPPMGFKTVIGKIGQCLHGVFTPKIRIASSGRDKVLFEPSFHRGARSLAGASCWFHPIFKVARSMAGLPHVHHQLEKSFRDETQRR